jgi:hypothetical protein
MMRKIFGGAMAFSMVGAVVLGGVLAWSNSQSFNQSATVGSLAFSLSPTHNTDRIGPNDNIPRITDNVMIHNTGGGTGFDLVFDTGHVDILDVVNVLGTTDQANCGAPNFVGTVQDKTGGATLTADTTKTPDGLVQVMMAVQSGAPIACEGDTVSYRVVINMKTKPGN